jgi:hypothetical protein
MTTTSTEPAKPLNMKVVDPAIVNRALKSLKQPTTGSFEDRVERLRAYQHDPEKVPDDHIVQCGKCNGFSDDRLDACPYCGEADTGAAPEAAASNGHAAEPASEPPDAEDATEVVAAPEEKPKTRSQAQLKAVKPELVPSPARSLDVSERALDRRITEVNLAKTKGAKAYWELGNAIKDIHDRKLYTQRSGVDGKPKYKSWLQFSQAELQMSGEHATRAMLVAASFTREDFEAIGISKLSLIAKLPEALQNEMTEKARAGLPLAEVEKQVRKLNPRSTGSKKPARVSKPPGPDELTAIVAKERVKVPMFARMKKPGAKPIRANTLGQDPSGEVELANGVIMYVHIVKEARGISVIIEHRRRRDQIVEARGTIGDG